MNQESYRCSNCQALDITVKANLCDACVRAMNQNRTTATIATRVIRHINKEKAA